MTHPIVDFDPILPSRTDRIEQLRRLLPEMTDTGSRLSFGLPAIDRCLPGGGLPCGGLHEIVPAPHGLPAAFGFIVALLSQFCSPLSERAGMAAGGCRVGGRVFLVNPLYGLRQHGRLYGHGLCALGLDPARLVLVEPANRKDTLWAIEEALRSDAPAAVAAAIDKLDLKSSQRLHFVAAEFRLPLLLMRPEHDLESSAAVTRWRVDTAQAARDRFGLFTNPRWHLRLERARNGRPGEWTVEYDHVAHRFSLAAALADSARACRTTEERCRAAEVHCA